MVFCRETFIEREPGESANDRNDRAIRAAAHWYSKHIPDSAEIKVVMLTNDRLNKEKAEQTGLLVYRCKSRGVECAFRTLSCFDTVGYL